MRRWVLALLAAVGIGAVVRTTRGTRPSSGPVQFHGRRGRALAMARAGGALGLTQATTEARKLFASAERREELDRERELKSTEQVLASLGQMKGVLMKLGQMLSYVDTRMPDSMRDALATLQQDAPPMSPELAASVVAEELGGPPDSVFAEWDEVPIAAASIGQVHRAVTHDGRAVAVKVQYPGVGDAIRADLANADMLVRVVGMMNPGMDSRQIAEEIRDRMLEELDYNLEADNQQLFVDYYRGHPFIRIPEVIHELCAGRVLTTELVVGARFDEVARTWTESERNLAAETIFRFVFRSLYRMHSFNGDPHPGNYVFHGSGVVTFLDFGLVKRWTRDEVALFENLALNLCVRPDPAGFRKVVEDAGMLRRDAKVTDQEVFDWYSFFYEGVLRDEETAVTLEYAGDMVSKYVTARFEDAELVKNSNLPKSVVVTNRINLGLVAVMARLGARGNFRRIAEELWPFTDGPPSTPMGEAEASWLATRTPSSAR